MAQPIHFQMVPRDPRAQLAPRLEQASADHGEALLAAWAVLQGLHERGVLELLRGVLGSGNAVVEIAVDAARAHDSIRAMRNLLLLANALSAIEPAVLADVTRAVPVALAQASADEARPPGIFKLLSTFLNRDFRRGLAALNDFLVALGRNLSAKERS